MSALAILKALTTAAQVGMTIYSGVKQNQETDKINAENRAIAEEEQAIQERQQNFVNQQTLRNYSLNRQQLEFQEEEADKNRTERQEERGYNRMQNAANKYAEYLNTKTGLTSSRLSPIFSRGTR